MIKLKSLDEFKKEGFELKNSEKTQVIGGSETYYFENTCQNNQDDRMRCSREDNPMLYTSQNTKIKCVYVALDTPGVQG